MKKADCLVILNHYQRPTNLPLCIRAWKDQSASPGKFIVVDNSPAGEGRESYPNMVTDGADDVWRIRDNLGCAAHFAPALMIPDYKYILFVDDDFLPGGEALEFMISQADALKYFSVLGPNGRLFLMDRPAGDRYSGRSIPKQTHQPVRTDITCQCHLIRSDQVHHILGFRNRILRTYPDESHLVKIHEDFILNVGIQMGSGFPSFVLPLIQDPMRRPILKRLPEPGAVWRRVEHWAERNRMVEICLNLGWERPPPIGRSPLWKYLEDDS